MTALSEGHHGDSDTEGYSEEDTDEDREKKFMERCKKLDERYNDMLKTGKGRDWLAVNAEKAANVSVGIQLNCSHRVITKGQLDRLSADEGVVETTDRTTSRVSRSAPRRSKTREGLRPQTSRRGGSTPQLGFVLGAT